MRIYVFQFFQENSDFDLFLILFLKIFNMVEFAIPLGTNDKYLEPDTSGIQYHIFIYKTVNFQISYFSANYFYFSIILIFLALSLEKASVILVHFGEFFWTRAMIKAKQYFIDCCWKIDFSAKTGVGNSRI